MVVVVYCDGMNGGGKRLLDAIGSPAPDCRTEVYSSITGLLKRIRRRKGDVSVALLCASSSKELEQLVGFCDLLLDLRIILILPDRGSETLSRGLLLRPRFFSFWDTDFADVSTVLRRMLLIYGKQSVQF